MAAKKKATSSTSATTTTTETKSAKFQRLANQRVSAALKRIHHIGNLGGPGYESNDDQRKKIETALTDAVAQTINRLNKTTVKPSGFSL